MSQRYALYHIPKIPNRVVGKNCQMLNYKTHLISLTKHCLLLTVRHVQEAMFVFMYLPVRYLYEMFLDLNPLASCITIVLERTILNIDNRMVY